MPLLIPVRTPQSTPAPAAPNPAASALPPGRIFRMSLKPDGTLELVVYEGIGENWDGSGVTAKNVKQQMDAAGNFSQISLRINSPGGDTFEGVAICNLLKSTGKPVHVAVDGIAASAASIIAMCGTTITMGSSAMMMIHNAWSFVIGDAVDLRKEADVLEKINESVAQAYMDRTGKSFAEIKAVMDAETWMTAQECVDQGFATAIAVQAPEEKAAALALAKGFQKTFAKLKKVPASLKVSADSAECDCSCKACMDDRCSDCTNADCVDGNCEDCPMQAGASASLMILARMETDRRMINQQYGVKAESVVRMSYPGTKAEAGSSESDRRITLLVAPYDGSSANLGTFSEVYQRGCFAAGLDRDPRMLHDHNEAWVLGRKVSSTARFWEDAAGLWAECDAPETSWADDLLVSMRRGDITQASAAFWILQQRWELRNGEKVRVIEKALLREASVKSFAAYESTRASVQPAAALVSQDSTELDGARLQLLRLR